MGRSLYKVKTRGCGVFHVIAKTFDAAAQEVRRELDDQDYGYSTGRVVTNVEFICREQFMANGKRSLWRQRREPSDDKQGGLSIMTYEELKQAAAVISHAKEMKYYVSKERFALAALTQLGIDDEKSVDIMYGFFCCIPDIVRRIAEGEKLTEKYLPKAIEIAEAAYSLRGGDGYDGTVPGIEDEGCYNKDRRRYFYRTKDGLDGHADFSLTQRSDIISLARFVERTDIEITGVAYQLDQLDTGELDSNRNRIMVDYYEGDIYFLFGDPTDRIFYDWFSHGGDAGVYVATDNGWRKLLYTPGRGYVGKDGELEFVDDKHFYSNYMLEASGKKFQYVGNIHHSLSVLVERRKKEKEEN